MMMDRKVWVRLADTKVYTPEFDDEVTYIVPINSAEDFTAPHFYASFPEVIRIKDYEGLKERVQNISSDERADGIMVHSVEGLELLKEAGFIKKIVAGPGLYAFNKASETFIKRDTEKYVIPLELSYHEMKELDLRGAILNIFGRTPLMITANCVRKTEKCCIKGKDQASPLSFGTITDRKRTDFPVLFQCDYCYNVIYNSVPTSLHEFVRDNIVQAKDGHKERLGDLMLSFSVESSREVNEITGYFIGILKGEDPICPIKEHTKAYFNHGVD